MRRILALAPAAALAGCVTITPSSIGTFAGVLPCADCAGILAELRLYTEQGRPTNYELMETYMGTREGDRSIGTAGRWTTLRGSVSDPDATVVQIDLGRIDALRNFQRVGDDELRLLDRKLNPIVSPAPRSLYRVSEFPAMTLVDADSGRTVEVERGQRVYVVLGANRATGYDWALDASTPAVLTGLGGPIYAQSADLAGSGGTAIWFFAATASGKEEMRFQYRRSFGDSALAVRTVSFTVVVR
jgi:copper homeostasis protein (lipoprotein)